MADQSNPIIKEAHPIHKEVYMNKKNGNLYTRNLEDQNEYRLWNKMQNPLAAAIDADLQHFDIKPRSIVLCVGVHDVTSVSHISDIVGHEGRVYAHPCFCQSQRCCDLEDLVARRSNITALNELAAKDKHLYEQMVGRVGIIYSEMHNIVDRKVVFEKAHEELIREAQLLVQLAPLIVREDVQFLLSMQYPKTIFEPGALVMEYFNRVRNTLQKQGFIGDEMVEIGQFEQESACLAGSYKMVKLGDLDLQ